VCVLAEKIKINETNKSIEHCETDNLNNTIDVNVLWETACGEQSDTDRKTCGMEPDKRKRKQRK